MRANEAGPSSHQNSHDITLGYQGWVFNQPGEAN